MLALRLPEEIEGRLSALAKATGRSKSFYAKAAILAHLDNLEDIYLAEATVERFAHSGEKTIPLDEMEKRLGLER